MSKPKGYLTRPGFTNPRRQRVERPTHIRGTHHLQSVSELRCTHCENAYSANASDIHIRERPTCQGGRPRLCYTMSA